MLKLLGCASGRTYIDPYLRAFTVRQLQLPASLNGHQDCAVQLPVDLILLCNGL